MENKYNEYRPGILKIIHHLDYLKAVKNKEVVAPIHVSVWPTIRCQLNCSYCCCRNVPIREGEINLLDFKSAVDVLSKYGTKAIEFSGGGEPLLWSHLEEAVNYLHHKNIKISLITNGIALNNASKNMLSKFSWLRISINSLKNAEKIKFDDIPTKYSASYIVSENNINDLKNLYDFAKSKNLIVRIAVQRPATKEFDEKVENLIKDLGDPLFFAKKETGTPLGCYMAWVRAAIDWKGNFLPCPSIQLNLNSEGKIPDDFILCHITKLEEWLLKNTPHDLGYKCEFCNCGKEHNDLIYNLQKGVNDVDFV